MPVLLSFGGISHKPFSSSCKPFIYLREMEDKSHKTDDRILMTTENQTTSWEFLECYKNIHKNVMWSPKIHQGTNWRNVEYFVKKVIAVLSWKPLGPHLKIKILPTSVFLMFLTSWFYILQKKIVKGYKKNKSGHWIWSCTPVGFKLATYIDIQPQQVVWVPSLDHLGPLKIQLLLLRISPLTTVNVVRWSLEKCRYFILR